MLELSVRLNLPHGQLHSLLPGRDEYLFQRIRAPRRLVIYEIHEGESALAETLADLVRPAIDLERRVAEMSTRRAKRTWKWRSAAACGLTVCICTAVSRAWDIKHQGSSSPARG